MAQQYMVFAFERDKLRAGNAICQRAALVDGDLLIIFGMKNACGRFDLSQTFSHVDIAKGFLKSHSVIGGGRLPLKLVKPFQFIGCGIGHEGL